MDDMEVIVFEDLPSKKTPLDADNLNKIQQNAKKAIKNRKPTIELLTVSSTAPSKCTIRDKYYNTTTSKIYTATAKNTWGTEGENPSNLYLYVDLEHKELYYYNGATFVSYGGGSGGGGDTLPVGSIIAYSSDTIPNGWLLCDGSSFSTTSYPELFEIIGTTYGYDDERNPKLPDLRGRVAVGKKAATSSSDTDFNELGKTGGEKTHTLTVDEMPSHTHDVAIAVNNTVAGGARYYFNSAGTTSAPITDKAAWSNSLTAKATGGGQPHNNLQPYMTTNFIIKAKMTVAIEGEIIQENGTASENNTYSAKAIDNKLKTNIITGQEVATNEYIDGKRVYFTRISINEYPGATATINHNINNIDEIIDYDAIFNLSSGETRKMPGIWKTDYSSFMSTVYQVTKKTMQIVLGSFWTSGTFKKAVITIKYTKNA